MIIRLYIVHKCTYIKNNEKNNCIVVLSIIHPFAVPCPLRLTGLLILVGQLVLQNLFHPESIWKGYQCTNKIQDFKTVQAFKASKFTANYKWVILTPRFVNCRRKLALTFINRIYPSIMHAASLKLEKHSIPNIIRYIWIWEIWSITYYS